MSCIECSVAGNGRCHCRPKLHRFQHKKKHGRKGVKSRRWAGHFCAQWSFSDLKHSPPPTSYHSRFQAVWYVQNVPVTPVTDGVAVTVDTHVSPVKPCAISNC